MLTLRRAYEDRVLISYGGRYEFGFLINAEAVLCGPTWSRIKYCIPSVAQSCILPCDSQVRLRFSRNGQAAEIE